MILDKDFIGREFPQNCGDSLLVLSNNGLKGNNKKWKCLFKKYKNEIFASKDNILKGKVVNSEIERIEFIEKIWLQNCGDSLKIIKKSNKQNNKKEYLWECEFINYPYKILAQKSKIIKGLIINPQIEQIEFIEKLWPQHCGDTLKIIKKTNKKDKSGATLFECNFINYSYKILALKGDIIKGEIINPKMPWRDKENLIKYIKENFEKSKPTFIEIANSLNISRSYLNSKILEFNIKNLINYNYSGEENQIRDFIESIYQGPIEKYSGKKEDNYYEIDIYLPELKKGIEYNGSNWHEEGNLNNKFSKSIGYHQRKQEFFIKKGIDILFIWDYEWFEDFPKKQVIDEKTKQKIKNFLQI